MNRDDEGTEPLLWTTPREALRVIAAPSHLRRTLSIAAVVGTILFSINQLDVVLRGDATAVVWVKVAVTYLVPFCVSNAGVLVGSQRTTRRTGVTPITTEPHPSQASEPPPGSTTT